MGEAGGVCHALETSDELLTEKDRKFYFSTMSAAFLHGAMCNKST